MKSPLTVDYFFAALMSDYQAAQQQDISGRPSWIVNNYTDEASW
jgi:hypothetical protein